MTDTQLMESSCRVAISAYLHDLGKFAERAKLPVDLEKLEIHLQQYARKQEAGGKIWYSHQHSAWTALMWDEIEKYFPPVTGIDPSPYKGWNNPDVDDSVVNAAAMHHKPSTFLQWITATADRVASGFERDEFDKYNDSKEHTDTGKNHYTARQLTIFEQINIEEKSPNKKDEIHWRYKLKPLSVDSLFPVRANNYETNNKEQAQLEYKALWKAFIKSLQKIPESHKNNWSLWLDHFDSAWAAYTQAIPSATAFGIKPEVSLYDHSKTTAAIATSLWRYHHENQHPEADVLKKLSNFSRPDWGEKKLLLIQGDFFGIQDFIFANGAKSQKSAAKLLRGRSFYVSLLTECAALKILEGLSLPPTSQVINAAGKFLIVAPNTDQIKKQLKIIQNELNTWFLKQTYGMSGIGFATVEASCNDFLSKQGGFSDLVSELFKQLEVIKKQRLNLTVDTTPHIFTEYLDNFDNTLESSVCDLNELLPATIIKDGLNLSLLSQDQISIGKNLTKFSRLLITTESLNENTLKIPIFGYCIQFTEGEKTKGKFGEIAEKKILKRAWDISLPFSDQEVLFKGYAKRFINAYIPKFGEKPNDWEHDKYKGVEEEWGYLDEPKTLNHISCEDRYPVATGTNYYSPAALMTLKGDVDSLGQIFEAGMKKPTFAKMAALSRQLNSFFAVWLPWYCSQHDKYKNIYTVFAGGDDFYLIGPWRSTIMLASDMKQHFQLFVAQNPQIHFSTGLVMTKPGMPIRQMGEIAEHALEKAKSYPDHVELKLKNAVTCFENTVSWDDFEKLLTISNDIDRLKAEFKQDISTGYLYRLQYLADQSQDLKRIEVDSKHTPRIDSALWNSHFTYRTYRMLKDMKLSNEKIQSYQKELGSLLGDSIRQYGSAFKIALFTHLYHHRK
jgi:CRISPR-associated protein Csm1